jgi:hypothetical protein
VQVVQVWWLGRLAVLLAGAGVVAWAAGAAASVVWVMLHSVSGSCGVCMGAAAVLFRRSSQASLFLSADS